MFRFMQRFGRDRQARGRGTEPMARMRRRNHQLHCEALESRQLLSGNYIVNNAGERTLLSAALPHHGNKLHGPAQVVDAKKPTGHHSKTHAPSITVLSNTSSGGYQFINFDGLSAGTFPETGTLQGTLQSGISNTGTSVGRTETFSSINIILRNFTVNPQKSKTVQLLNINGSTTPLAVAEAVNSSGTVVGTVVGTDNNGFAFYASRGRVKTFMVNGAMNTNAFGINDRGTIVGQYVTSTAISGFIRVNSKSYITINAPSGPNAVEARGINNNGLVVGFYVGTDGQDHGFMANEKSAVNGTLTGVAIADPTIPNVPGEPGATFVGSKIFGINDKGIAVGSYLDSTRSEHGFLYNTETGVYTFLDDPGEAFVNDLESTQITGITNSGEITGYYSDANLVFHGFVANPIHS